MTPGTPPSGKSLLLKVFLPIGVILLLVFSALTLVKSRAHLGSGSVGTAQIKEGAVLNDFDLSKFKGQSAPMSSLPGKVFLINFWASWCEACMVEMPSIVKLWNEFHGQGFEVLAVNVDENPDAVIPALSNKLHMEFPIFIDKDQALGNLFDVRAIPMSLIIDHNRKILFIDTGERDWSSSEVREQLKQWLAKT